MTFNKNITKEEFKLSILNSEYETSVLKTKQGRTGGTWIHCSKEFYVDENQFKAEWSKRNSVNKIYNKKENPKITIYKLKDNK